MEIKTYNQLLKFINQKNTKNAKSHIAITEVLKQIDDTNLWKEDKFYNNKKQLKKKPKTFNEFLSNLSIAHFTYTNIKNIIAIRGGKTIITEWGYSNATEWLSKKPEIRRKIVELAKIHLKENPTLVKEAINFESIYTAEIAKKYKPRSKIIKSKRLNERITRDRNGYKQKNLECLQCKDLEKENKKLKQENEKLRITINTLRSIDKAS